MISRRVQLDKETAEQFNMQLIRACNSKTEEIKSVNAVFN